MADGSTTGAICCAVAGRVATITIDRPEKRNAMSWPVLADFRDAVVITGAGGAFCAGTDLAELARTPEAERSGGGRFTGT